MIEWNIYRNWWLHINRSVNAVLTSAERGLDRTRTVNYVAASVWTICVFVLLHRIACCIRIDMVSLVLTSLQRVMTLELDLRCCWVRSSNRSSIKVVVSRQKSHVSHTRWFCAKSVNSMSSGVFWAFSHLFAIALFYHSPSYKPKFWNVK